MKSRITMSLGLVLMLAMGVLVSLLALGSFDARPVSAGHDTTDVTSVTAAVDPVTAGAVAKQTITFVTPSALIAGADSIIIQFQDDVKMPDVIDPSTVTIIATHSTFRSGSATGTLVANPISVTKEFVAPSSGGNQDEPRLTLLLADMGTGEDGSQGIAASSSGGASSTVTVIFNQTAGLKNPTEGTKDYDVMVWTSKDTDSVTSAKYNIPMELILNDDADNRGKTLTVVGRGFQDTTTATVWLDTDNDGTKDAGETILGTATVGKDDTFTLSFTAGVPPFLKRPSVNYIRAIDGQQNTDCVDRALGDSDGSTGSLGGTDCAVQSFKIDGLFTITPKSAAIGDTVTATIKDWPNDDSPITTQFNLGGVTITGASITITNGEATFTFDIPDGVTLGVQQINFATTESPVSASEESESDDQKMTILGSPVEVTPSTVAPNQTVTIQGRGFNKSSGFIDEDDSTSGNESKITIGGVSVPTANIDEGSKVDIDSSGNWVASVVVPVTATTTVAGTYDLKAFDDGGREGITTITIPARLITLSPPESRLGSVVTIEGTGYPARNADSAQDISISVKYTAGSASRSVTATPDASGRFVANLTVPLSASIPSTNTVTVSYTYTDLSADGASNLTVTDSLTHRVPGATLVITPVEGEGGTTVTLSGAGFKGFTTASELKIGAIDVLPSPAPSTGSVGTFSQTFVVPQLDTGAQSVKVKIGGTTASVPFTVLAGPAIPLSAALAPADAFADLIANSDNLLRAWYFDPASQDAAPDFGWFLFDPRPVFAAANTYGTVASGNFVWVLVREGQTATICGSSRTLFTGWNPVVC